MSFRVINKEFCNRRPATQTGKILQILSFTVFFILTGCASFGDYDRDSPQIKVPPAVPKSLGVETPVSEEHRHLIELFGGEYRWRPAHNYLNTILARLAANGETSSQIYRVTILNTPVVNAFALPSGNIYVTRGLLALANDSAEVAAVMAHEIAHVTAHHAAQREELEKRSALISKAANLVQGQKKSVAVLKDSRRSLAGFSRQQELEADEIGVRTIARAGYDPYAAARFLAALGRSTTLRNSLFGQQISDETPDILATHPSTPERVAQAIACARQIGAQGIGTEDRNEYLASIDGMLFGDDPTQGTIRGRVFVHPKLGFGFTAPEGFVLENSNQAVLGVAEGGNEALRLDSIKLPLTVSLQSYLVSGWIDHVQTSSIVNGQLSDLPYAIASAKGDEWSFRVAVIRLGNDVYRMIFAARDLTQEAEARFQAAIRSFHRLNSYEVQNVHGLHLALITAGPSDSFESLAAKMVGVERPRDYFMLINGLGDMDHINSGQKYKIVVE